MVVLGGSAAPLAGSRPAGTAPLVCRQRHVREVAALLPAGAFPGHSRSPSRRRGRGELVNGPGNSGEPGMIGQIGVDEDAPDVHDELAQDVAQVKVRVTQSLECFLHRTLPPGWRVRAARLLPGWGERYPASRPDATRLTVSLLPLRVNM